MKTNTKATAAAAEKRRNTVWIENSLASSDEDLNASFNWKSVRIFTPYLKQYRVPAILSVVFMLLYTVLNLANPYLIGLAIDNYITRHDLKGLAIIGGILLLVNIAMWQAQYWQVWNMSWTGQQILYHVSSDMYAHLQKLSLSFYDRTQIGRVMSRLQSDIDVLRQVARGLSNREIGADLFISQHTVANHVRSILRKTASANRTEATAYAYRRNLARG